MCFDGFPDDPVFPDHLVAYHLLYPSLAGPKALRHYEVKTRAP